MNRVKVLIVDDSFFVREAIKDILSEAKDIVVIGEAVNGKEAVRMIPELRPNIVTMDIEMPEMNGLEAIEHIMAFHAVPILVVTSKTDSVTAFHAVSKGALEVIPKPLLEDDPKEFIQKIRFLSKVRVISHIRSAYTVENSKMIDAAVVHKNKSEKIVAIASSTGGPKALSIVLSELPKTFPCPIVIAQHMADGFTCGMIKWLEKLSNLSIKIAENGERIVSGSVYVSPSEYHMEISYDKTVRFKQREPKDIYFPSCNVLLTSIARVYGRNSIGVILTGMGDDGKIGAGMIKSSGGVTIAQDESTSLIFGMPKAAIDAHCIDKILPLGEISKTLVQLVS